MSFWAASYLSSFWVVEKFKSDSLRIKRKLALSSFTMETQMIFFHVKFYSSKHQRFFPRVELGSSDFHRLSWHFLLHRSSAENWYVHFSFFLPFSSLHQLSLRATASSVSPALSALSALFHSCSSPEARRVKTTNSTAKMAAVPKNTRCQGARPGWRE